MEYNNDVLAYFTTGIYALSMDELMAYALPVAEEKQVTQKVIHNFLFPVNHFFSFMSFFSPCFNHNTLPIFTILSLTELYHSVYAFCIAT